MILLSGSLLWLGSRSTDDSLVFKKIEVFLEAPDVLVDVAHGAGDNDGNEKKKVKLKQNQIPEIRWHWAMHNEVYNHNLKCKWHPNSTNNFSL